MHEGVFGAYVLGEINRNRRRCLTRFPPSFERDAYRMRMRCSMRERFLDGRLQFGRTESIEQAQQSQGDGAQIAAACRCAYEQFLAGRDRVGEAIGAAMLAIVLSVVSTENRADTRAAITAEASKIVIGALVC